MEFKELNEKIQKRFELMQKSGKLFRVGVTGDEVWNTYISNFTKEQDPVFRDPESTTHTCNNDKNFLRRYGNVVALDKDLNLMTMFDIEVEDPYVNSMKALHDKLSSAPIVSLFTEDFYFLKHKTNYSKVDKNDNVFQLGHSPSLKRYTQEEVDKFGVVNTKDTYTFYHFNVNVKRDYISFSGQSLEAILEAENSSFRLLEKGLKVDLSILETVRDLINQNSLLRGDTYIQSLTAFIEYKKAYDQINVLKQREWIWYNVKGFTYARFINTLIGQVCKDLAAGEDINKVCKDFNYRIDPVNYMKASSPITKKQIEDAEKFVNELGYTNSFSRRFAKLDDIHISEILHANSDKVEKTAGLFADVKATKSENVNINYENVEEVTIHKFMSDILPNVNHIEVLLENRLEDNLVCLTTADNSEKNPFKWSNPFSWTYKNNLSAKSFIKENVKKAGGQVEGDVRFSILWNDDETKASIDFDAHAIEPNKKRHIYYGEKDNSDCNGFLDVDMIRPRDIGVENIVWPSKKQMQKGSYELFVVNFDGKPNRGFKAELVVEGNTYTYKVDSVRSNHGEKVQVAIINFDGTNFSIDHKQQPSNFSKTMWNLESNKFHKVNLMCLSPNYWGENNIGNKHYMFMIDNCTPDDKLSSFHVDNLKAELLEKRKVFDLLASTQKLEPYEGQLAGIGFNSSEKNHIIVKLKGSFNRVIKINF